MQVTTTKHTNQGHKVQGVQVTTHEPPTSKARGSRYTDNHQAQGALLTRGTPTSKAHKVQGMQVTTHEPPTSTPTSKARGSRHAGNNHQPAHQPARHEVQGMQVTTTNQGHEPTTKELPTKEPPTSKAQTPRHAGNHTNQDTNQQGTNQQARALRGRKKLPAKHKANTNQGTQTRDTSFKVCR